MGYAQSPEFHSTMRLGITGVFFYFFPFLLWKGFNIHNDRENSTVTSQVSTIQLQQYFVNLVSFISPTTVFTCLTFSFGIISDVQKNCKNNTRSSHIPFFQISQMLTFCYICFNFALPSLPSSSLSFAFILMLLLSQM